MLKKILAAKTTLTFGVSICVVLSQNVNAGIPVADGLNLSQNTVSAMENVAHTLKQIEQYEKQVEQYTKQLDQYENQIQNTAAPAAYIWDQANSVINKLVQAQDMLNYYTNQAGSLEAYLSKYQDVSYYRSSPCFSSGGCSAAERAAMEDNRRIASQSQKKANDAMFKGIEQQQQNLQSDARQLERLQAAASTADGQVKAIQYASQISSQQANQLLQIRALLLAQQGAEAARSQAELDKEAKATAASEQLRRVQFVPSTATKGMIR